MVDEILEARRRRARSLRARRRRRRARAATRRASAAALLVPDDATVQPARLALGLRRRLIERGVRDPRALARARAAGQRAARGGGRDGRRRGCAPAPPCSPSTPPPAACGRCASRLSVTSSHIVLTEPVPDVLEQIGWTGGESITDGATVRALLPHDARRADRCSAGAAAGWRSGARLTGASRSTRTSPRPPTEHLVDISRRSKAARITHAWGGPIDVVAEPPAADRHARRRAGALRVRVHRQRRRPVAPGRARARRAGARARATGRSRSSIPRPPSCRPSRWPGSAGWSCAARSCAPSGAYADGGAPDPLTRAVSAAAAGARDPRVAMRAGAPVAGMLAGGDLLLLLAAQRRVDVPAVQVGAAHGRADVEPRVERGGHPSTAGAGGRASRRTSSCGRVVVVGLLRATSAAARSS